MKKIFLILLTLTGFIMAQDVNTIVNKADEAFKLDRIYSETELIIVKNGKEQPIQVLRSYSTTKDGESMSLSVYESPKKMKGNANLMIGDDLWVKFASTGRVRKLSSSAKKNSSGGSDFSYADMGSGSEGMANDYISKLLGEDKVDGSKCYKIEFKPKAGVDAAYEKLIVYIDTQEYKYLKIEYYEDNANTKSLYLSDYRDIDGVNYPFIIEMRNHTKDSVSTMKTTKLEFNSPEVKDSLFSQSYLKKIR